MSIIALICFFSSLPITNFVSADKSDQAGKSEVAEMQHMEQKEEVLRTEHKTEKLEQKAKKKALKAEEKAKKATKD